MARRTCGLTNTSLDNRLELTVHVPTVHFSIGNRSVRIELRVPQSIASTIHTGDGSINLEDLKGVTRLTTGDGSIGAMGLDGTVEARTGDGSVKIDAAVSMACRSTPTTAA